MGGAGEALGTRLGHRDTGTPGRSGWPASMQIYWNKRKRLHKKTVQLPEDWFGTLHQHGRRFIVLEHQYGRRDVMWKHSIAPQIIWQRFFFLFWIKKRWSKTHYIYANFLLSHTCFNSWAPYVRKFGNLSIRENLVMTSAYWPARTYVLLGWG